ncbi:sodium:alanine symporter family protein [Corynebacterium glyciniphilum]|uniref:alanine/glycine:cation symporter family protein n=1 Tax=Corynebacterium glyciniphilum TaxID=1404244 RepID=UPI002655EEAE|nr:alanine/glycine:cation symporter family protein [Corynebacterium glyciniphilum]MDN5682337.1 alanine:cation symporter family protein [Corynebacterium glyciniphilum]MDN6706461.1 alanine:cation symporter family protein [Corynebacterium glyciniphilum]
MTDFITSMNDGVWSVVVWALVGAGLYFGVRTILVQLRLFPQMFGAVAEAPYEDDEMLNRDPEAAEKKGISPFKAFTISAASRVGTGNVAGVAVAITLGGPGAVFWMWIIAILGGATSFVEATLAQLYKTRDYENNAYRGGPAYYITRGLNKPVLAVIFGIVITLIFGFINNALQTNSIVESVGRSADNDGLTLKIIIGLAVAALTAVIVFGGVQRIASVTQVIVPFMAVIYIGLGVIVVLMNLSEIPGVIAQIVGHALGFREVAGAAVGAAFMNGMRRGLFSNEAGQGSAPNAAGTAAVSHPVKQGLVQTLGVYFDTLVVCSVTAFIILLSNPPFGEGIQGASLTQDSVAAQIGDWGIHVVTFILFFLAFSSVIGNYYLAQSNVEYFTKNPAVMFCFRLLVVVCVFLGAIVNLPVIWALADTFTAIMVVVNLCAIVPLCPIALKLLRNYTDQKKLGLDPVFRRSMLPELKNIECWDDKDDTFDAVPARTLRG